MKTLINIRQSGGKYQKLGLQGCFLVFSSLIRSKNVCSKQVKGYFLVFSSSISIAGLMLCYKKCYSKQAGQLFSLFCYFFSRRNVLKTSEGCFLVYSSLISIVRLMFCHIKCGMLNQYYTNFRKLREKIHLRFFSKLYKTFARTLYLSTTVL